MPHPLIATTAAAREILVPIMEMIAALIVAMTVLSKLRFSHLYRKFCANSTHCHMSWGSHCFS